MNVFTKWLHDFICPGAPEIESRGRRIHLGVQATPVGLTCDQAHEMAFRLLDCARQPGEPIMRFADDREPTTNERHLLNLLSWREREAVQAKKDTAVQEEQLNVAVNRAQRFREALLRLARSPCPSAPWIRDIVAKTLDMPLKTLEGLLEES